LEEATQGYSHHTIELRKLFARRVAPIDKAVRPLDSLNVIAKVTFGGKLFLRGDKEKRGYKGPLFKALPGDLIISKIRVGQGSFCVIGDNIDHVAVSPEYPVYTPDPLQVLPRFLAMVLRTPEFMRRLTGSASGNTTKRRIHPAFFESLKIPLPDLTEQQTIVAAYDAALAEAAQKEKAADAAEAKAMANFEAALGFAPPAPLPDRPIFVASFKNLDRWSHEGVLRVVLELADPVPTFPVFPLGSVGKVSYCLQKFPGNRPGLHPRPYLRVANVQRNRLDLTVIKTINVPDEEMHRYRLEDGDILLCEGNSAELVGRGAIWRGQIIDCVHQNHVLRVRLDQTKVLPEFVLSVINSSYGQIYFRAKAKQTTNLASINSKEVASFPLPLPPLNDQQSLIKTLNKGRAEAAALRAEAAAGRTKARAEFEAPVYAAADPIAATDGSGSETDSATAR
jgi:type I restriction enzyme S subunit